jgi:hypothetical protein
VETPPDADDAAKALAQGHRRQLDQALGGLLSAENVVVFCGLGTSLSVKDQAGARVAPSMQDLWHAAEEKAEGNFAIVKEKTNYATPDGGDNVELLLSRCQVLQTVQPDPVVAEFIAETEQLIVDRCRFVTDEVLLPVHEAFIRKLARRSTRKPRLKLFTSNYDLCFEAAGSRTGFVIVDGFSYTLPQEFDGIHFGYDFVRRETGRETPDYIPNTFHLYKLHGSVSWERNVSRIRKSLTAQKPLIVYPRDSKFESSYEQPFIEMMSRFQMALRVPNTGLLVVGCGFNDRHLTEPILSAMRSNVSLRAVFVAPNLETSTRPTVQDVAQLIRAGDERLMLVAATFEEIVPMLPSLVATTEEEEHTARVRNLPARG